MFFHSFISINQKTRKSHDSLDRGFLYEGELMHAEFKHENCFKKIDGVWTCQWVQTKQMRSSPKLHVDR